MVNISYRRRPYPRDDGMYAIKALALTKPFKDIQALSKVVLMKIDAPTRSTRTSCGRRSNSRWITGATGAHEPVNPEKKIFFN